MQKQEKDLKENLDKARLFYSKAKAGDRQILKKEILDNEQRYEYLLKEMKKLEKRIRNEENKFLTNQ